MKGKRTLSMPEPNVRKTLNMYFLHGLSITEAVSPGEHVRRAGNDVWMHQQNGVVCSHNILTHPFPLLANVLSEG